jgi:hypothetical protein
MSKRFKGYIGDEPFEGTIEEWACRTGGVVTGPNTISIDLNKPTPLTLVTKLGSERPESYTITAGHKPGKRACAGALQHPVPATRTVSRRQLFGVSVAACVPVVSPPPWDSSKTALGRRWAAHVKSGNPAPLALAPGEFVAHEAECRAMRGER